MSELIDVFLGSVNVIINKIDIQNVDIVKTDDVQCIGKLNYPLTGKRLRKPHFRESAASSNIEKTMQRL